MSSLNQYIGKPVTVITSDGRLFIGVLQGFDQTTNLILESAKERVVAPDRPTETVELGLYLLRGENIVLCGLIDDEIESEIDWTKVYNLSYIKTDDVGTRPQATRSKAFLNRV
ncbi:uncharacterized protein V1510DRAFT_294084 [Dipodascopsis tothii]|uniref:uncharacterized protein n=1 Tax=Dipodascopsis tothii TaxID=44089 RepID=UPI0034CF8F76